MKPIQPFIIDKSLIKNKQVEVPFIFCRADRCPSCHSERALEVIDQNDNGIGFSRLLDMVGQGAKLKLYGRVFDHMICKKCNTEFKLAWLDDTDIPRPLTRPVMIDYFLKRNYNILGG